MPLTVTFNHMFKNVNLCYNIQTVWGRAFIFHINILCDEALPLISFLVRRTESPENYCHSPGVVVGGDVGVVVPRQKL